jgi:hypothetical protein
MSRTSAARERAVQCSLLQRRARVENTRTGGERFTSHVSMEEKAAEGNVAYFAEYATEELASKLVKYRDEDGRTLLHTAAAAGASSRGFASPRFLRSDAPIPRSPFPPPRLQRRQARPGRVLPRHRCRQRAGERQRRGARLFETSLARRETHAPNATIARRDETGAHSASEDAAKASADPSRFAAAVHPKQHNTNPGTLDPPAQRVERRPHKRGGVPLGLRRVPERREQKWPARVPLRGEQRTHGGFKETQTRRRGLRRER